MWSDIRFAVCIVGIFVNTWLLIVSPPTRSLSILCIAALVVGALANLGGPDDEQKGEP